MDRSAVFMVPMRNMFGGTRNADRLKGRHHRLATLVLLDDRQEFAEDSGDIPPVDLVDDQVELLLGLCLCVTAHFLEDAFPQGEAHPPLMQFWAVALDKVLVSVSRVETAHADLAKKPGTSHDFDFLGVGQFFEGLTRKRERGEVDRRPLRPEGLAGPRRSVEDDLALAFELGLDAPWDAFEPRCDPSFPFGGGAAGLMMTGLTSDLFSASTRFSGDFFSRWTVVWSPSGSGSFHSSRDSHSTGRRCGKSEADSNW